MMNFPRGFKELVGEDARSKYFSKNPLKRVLLRRFFEKIHKLVEEMGAGTVLEVGCGEGVSGYLILERFPGLEYVGADISREVVMVASRVLERDLVVLDGLRLPFGDKSFDLVIFLEVFEHIKEWEKVLLEGSRVGSKGVIFSVPIFPWYQVSNLVFLKNIRRLGEHPGHIHQFTLSGMRREVKGVFGGMDYEEKQYIRFPWLIHRLKF